MRLAAEEYARFLWVLKALSSADWRRPTDCEGWDVHAVAGHVLGMAEVAGSLVEQARQLLPALRSDAVFIDALTALQVARHRRDTPEQIIAQLALKGQRGVKGRRRAPQVLRNRTLPVPQQVGDGMEDWTVGFLVDVILTRDTWMHRLDLCRAVGVEPRLNPEHDGMIVADVATEWAGRHQQACELRLTGPAGGEWSFGSEGPSLELDAVEFCRLLSGRGSGPGLLAVQVPF